ncbi:MAG: hypothetical protein CSA81_05220 [Acidobacteria bacterium]|nr:MAG: hypothetical protein CSA81_05220 [Acidobacteriota bacterium]
MKTKIACGLMIITFLPLWGLDQFDIPHVAADTWKTTLTVYNLGSNSESITVSHWDQDGVLTGSGVNSVPAHGSIELLSSSFGYNGIARVESSEDAAIRVKLSYLFLKDQSESLCEFFVQKNQQATKWFLPNPYQDHFDWFGIAVANHRETAVNLTLTAYKNREEVSRKNLQLGSREKEVGISNSLWSGLGYGDIDFVVIQSDQPISVPISITGNDEQDRHLFFAATDIPLPGSVLLYKVAHIEHCGLYWT